MQSKAFTKLFASITDSSIWSEDDATRIIWITMLAMADWTGYVGASIPGLAARSRKSIPEVEAALAKFKAPDPYSRTRDYEGRRVADVDGGWVLLTYEKHREVATAEARKDSKRRCAAKARAAAKETETSLSTSRHPLSTVDISSTSPSVSVVSDLKSGSPDPERARPTPAQGQPLVYYTLDGWAPPDGFDDEVKLAGLTPDDFRAQLAKLRTGPIGGARGVLDRTEYVRSLLPTWRTWAEAARAKAVSDAAKGARSAFAGSRHQRDQLVLEASDAHRRYAAKHGLDLDALMSDIHRKDYVGKLGLERAREIIGEQLSKLARAKAKVGKAGAGVTP
jgi:pyruvate/2-oxoglutarate dehydrogenase complex dihydrolipoamide acyltransferase (E2) component